MKKFGLILMLIAYPTVCSGVQIGVQSGVVRGIRSSDESAVVSSRMVGNIPRIERNKPVYEIGVLIDEITPEINPLFEALKTEIVAVVGEDATILFPDERILVNAFDLGLAERHYQSLLDDDTDIIIAFGQINSAVLSRQTIYPKPTILFGAVNRDVIAIGQDADTSGVDNFTYLITSQSYVRDLTTLKELVDFKHIGVIVDGPTIVEESVRAVVEPLLARIGVTYSLFRTTRLTVLPPALKGLTPCT